MSGRSDVEDIENLGDSLPSWISDHLGEKTYMADEVNQLPLPPPKESSPRDEPSDHGKIPI